MYGFVACPYAFPLRRLAQNLRHELFLILACGIPGFFHKPATRRCPNTFRCRKLAQNSSLRLSLRRFTRKSSDKQFLLRWAAAVQIRMKSCHKVLHGFALVRMGQFCEDLAGLLEGVLAWSCTDRSQKIVWRSLWSCQFVADMWRLCSICSYQHDNWLSCHTAQWLK